MLYRKKPVVIEAVLLDNTERSIKEALEFMGQTVCASTFISQEKFSEYCEIVKIKGLQIKTLEGVMTASIGDYIIKGVQGEFYPCKPDIFKTTYEKVEDNG